MQRHFHRTTFLEPKQSDIDRSNNDITEYDQETIDLLGMRSAGDESDELNISSLPRGELFDWNPALQNRVPPSDEADIPPEEWIKHKTMESEASSDVLQVPVRDDGKAYSIDLLYPDQKNIMLTVLDKIEEWMSCRNYSEFKQLTATHDN